jgi:hypothetical protein
MAYVPNASDTAQPTGDKAVASAAPEFRTLKTFVASMNSVVDGFQTELDAIIAALGAGGGSAAALAALLASNTGSNYVGFLQSRTGSVYRTQQQRGEDWISLRDFGAVGTADPANEALDDAALLLAAASGQNIWIPAGDYYFSSTIVIGASTKLYGAGEGVVRFHYLGTTTAIVLGNTNAGISLTYGPECGGFTLLCTDRAVTVNGIVLQNAVYYHLEHLTIVGSGNPNSATPADWVLYGAGLTVSHNSILGTVYQVSCRIWNIGQYWYTKATGMSYWSAAASIIGGEVANNMYGIMIGDPAIAFNSATGVKFDSVWVQGNYTTGVVNYSGESTIFDNIYFEGNANYDYDVGGGAANPVLCHLHRSALNTESIGVTNYGNFPYLSKIRVREGSFNSIEYNDCSISTSIPLVIIDVAAIETKIKNNRLNSIIATTGRISNTSTTTITEDNAPEAPRVAVSFITRTLDTASGVVSYTGLGFQPTSIEFTGAVDTAPESFIGFAGVGVGLVQRCLTIDATNNKFSSTDCIRLIKTGAGNEQKAVLTTFDLDGFTLTWTKVGAPPANDLIINYVARR